MKVPEKLTKTEGAILVLTLLFVLCTAAVFWRSGGGEEMEYVVRSEYAQLAQEDPSQEEWDESWLLEEPTAEKPLNLNSADVEELDLLPGVGPVLAERIVAYRAENGPFAAKEDIMKVSGIGEGIFAQIEDVITVEETAE